MAKESTHLSSLKEVLYGVGITFILGMVGYVLMFFIKLLAARYFGPEQYGLYELLITILGLAVVIADMGITFGVQRYVAFYTVKKKLKELRGYRLFAIGWPLVTAILISIILYVLSNNIAKMFSLPSLFSTLLKILVIAIPFRTINSYFSYYFLAENKPFFSGFGYNVLERIILFVGVGIILINGLNLVYFILFFVLSIILSSGAYIFFYIRSSLKISEKAKFKIKEWVYFSTPLMLMGFLGYILSWTDNFVIAGYIGSGAVGIYGVAYSLASYLLFIPALFAGLLMPILTKKLFKSAKDFKKIFTRTSIWVFGATVFIGALLVAFSNQIIFVLFGSDFLSGTTTLLVLSILFAFTNIFAFYYMPMLIQKKSSFLFYNNLSWVLVNIFLSLLLVNILGIFGVALASGLTLFFLRLSEYIYSQKIIRLKLSFFPLLKIISVGIVSVVLTKLFFILILSVQVSLGIKLLVAGCIYAGIFIILLFVLKVFSYEDYDLMLLLENKTGLNLNIIKKLLRKL